MAWFRIERCCSQGAQPATAFELVGGGKRRKTCKVCNKKRKAESHAASSDFEVECKTRVALANAPERCNNPHCEVEGGRLFDKADFQLRKDRKSWAYRPECRKCHITDESGMTGMQRMRARKAVSEV